MRENKQQISFHKLLCNYLVYTRRCAHISIPRPFSPLCRTIENENIRSIYPSISPSIFDRGSLYTRIYIPYIFLFQCARSQSRVLSFASFDSTRRIESKERNTGRKSVRFLCTRFSARVENTRKSIEVVVFPVERRVGSFRNVEQSRRPYFPT